MRRIAALLRMFSYAMAIGVISSSPLFGWQSPPSAEYPLTTPAKKIMPAQDVADKTNDEPAKTDQKSAAKTEKKQDVPVESSSKPVLDLTTMSAVDELAPCDSCSDKCASKKCQPKCSDNAKPNPCAGSHKTLFFTNNFDYLKDEGYSGNCLGDQLKGHKVGQCGNLDVGGQIRFRYHSESGMGQRAGFTRFQDTDNDFVLSRLRLYGDWKANDRFRFYIEGIYANVLTANSEYVPRVIDQNFGDLLNLFADVKLFDDTIVRIGRQEMLYGAQRLISPLDWANTRRTFDGVRLITKTDDVRIDAFYTQAIRPIANDFDTPNEDLDFFGTYLTYKGWENKTLDLYALGLNNNDGPTQTENFVTYGSRFQGSTKSKVLYESEGMIQTGRNDVTGQDITAYAWTTGLGYQIPGLCRKPTLWGFYDFASGDGPGGADNGFNDLFPLGHKYLGFIDAVQRNNIESANLRLTMEPSKKLSLLFWYYNFQADEPASNVLSFGGTPAQDPNASKFGNELDILATYNVGPRSSILGGYSHLWRGTKILGDTDADFFYMQWQTNF